MNRDVVIIGAGGHGKVIADIVLQSGDRVLGFLDDNAGHLASVAGIPILGRICDYSKYKDAQFVIAIGNSAVRQSIANELRDVCWYTAIHPAAVISPLAVNIGEGSVVMANAVVNPGTTIGRHCIINTAAVVEHDNGIGDFCHISVGAKLAGTVMVGEHSWIGIGAVVSNNCSICDHSTVGAGGVVVKNITESGIYVGLPVRKIK